jgi:hypothetical protein
VLMNAPHWAAMLQGSATATRAAQTLAYGTERGI